MVRQWMSTLPKISEIRKVPYVETPTPERISRVEYGMAMWSPPADKVAEIVSTVTRRNQPFTCLVPSCLTHQLSDTKEVREKIKKMTKVVLLQSEVT